MTAPSYSTVTPANMELSPCRVTFGVRDLGGTLGNVIIKPSFKKAEIKSDQFGDSPLDRRVSGLRLTVETILAEIKNKDNWNVALPHLRDTTVGADRVEDFISKIGQSDLDLADSLFLHPLSLADSDESHDFYIKLATAESITEVVYGPEAQQGLKVVWNAYLDTSVVPAFLARYGKHSVVVP